MHLVPPLPAERVLSRPYSAPVCRALVHIRSAKLDAERDLDPAQIRELSGALQILWLAALLEMQLSQWEERSLARAD